MMTKNTRLLPLGLVFSAATALVLTVLPACAQSAPAQPSPAKAAPAQAPAASPIQVAPAKPAVPVPDRSQAYYHAALAGSYMEEAVTQGHPELIDKAVEEYKYALNDDPDSAQLHLALAELYFNANRPREAESTARALLKSAPENVDAHQLLGRIYLRQLSEGQNAPSSTSPSGNPLDQAITEFETIVALKARSVQDRVVLGQLYSVKQDAKKAVAQFEAALAIEPDSEEVRLNLVRLYAQNNDLEKAAKVIEAVPVTDRTPKMEDALGGAYKQLKKYKEAIAAYQRALDMEPGDLRIRDALAQSQLDDNQLDEALKQYRELAEAAPEDVDALVHISEIERRQQKYEAALASIRAARKRAPAEPRDAGYNEGLLLEIGYNEGLLLDVLARYEEAAQVYEKMVELTSHANGAYTAEEKSNRAIFLERLGLVYHEQGKSAEAIATYQKLIDLGGEHAVRGYQFEVEALRDDKQFDKAVEVAGKAVANNPRDRDLKLMLAGELIDLNKADEGIALAKSLLANTSEDRPIWIELAQMYVRAHRWKEGEEALDKAETLTVKPEDRTTLLFMRGEWAERQKHYEQSEQFFRQALQQDPANAMTLNYLGYMMADRGKQLPEALKLIRKAVDLDPLNGAYLDSLGWVYFKMNDYESAEQYLRQAVERDSSDPSVHDHLGDLYEKTGRIRLAAAQWEISVKQYAKSAPADVDPAEQAKVQKKLDSARVKLAKEESVTGPVKP
ncbi:MAG: tetratricopeptide repeat protein [Terracidiphilus sp.]